MAAVDPAVDHGLMWSSQVLRMIVMDLMRDGVSLNQIAVDPVDCNDAKPNADRRPRSVSPGAAVPVAERTVALQTVVLQPVALTGVEGVGFEVAFAQALQPAAVILVDLIWLDQVDQDGLMVLRDVMKRANAVRTTVSFLSMDAPTRQWLDQQWDQENAAMAVGRNDLFAPDFEQFLANYQARREATLLAVEIASTRQW
jgi:hypothetical protein